MIEGQESSRRRILTREKPGPVRPGVLTRKGHSHNPALEGSAGNPGRQEAPGGPAGLVWFGPSGSAPTQCPAGLEHGAGGVGAWKAGPWGPAQVRGGGRSR